MAFLPIVQRELRVATRRKSTYRIRKWTAVIAMGVSFVLLLFASTAQAGASLGKTLFGLLTGYAFGLCLLAGVLLTADSLSEEKREGTLGLLFLADLKGYDVVLGKFVALSLNAFYGLLALLPITALPLLLGAVTGVEFWRMALALLNALFVSLAAGVFVSALARNSQRAMGNTLGLVLLLAAGLPLLAGLGRQLHLSPVWLGFTWLSPFYPFSYAAETLYARHAGMFWATLFASNVLGWVFIALASLALPRSWQERTPGFGLGTFRRSRRPLSRRSAARRIKARAVLLPRNPVLWLLNNDLGPPWGAWAVVLAWGVTVLVATMFLRDRSDSALVNWYAAMPFGFLLKLLFGLQAGRFFAEGRRNGALELLLCTPLTSRQITSGQALALWRRFFWPLLAFLVLLFAPALVQVMAAVSTRDLELGLKAVSGSAFGIFNLVFMAADLAALCWFGMWLALSMKKPQFAPAVTICCVLILPTFLCWGRILVDLVLIAWGLTKLQQDLRWLLARQSQPAFPASAQLLPVAPAGPPPAGGPAHG